jgi:hypothetical protein
MNQFIERKYHIYLNNNCIYHCLSEEEFNNIWSILNTLNDFLSKNNHKNKIEYEEVFINKEVILESSY